MNRYDIFESISQRENGALSEENTLLARIAHELRRAVDNSNTHEAQYGTGRENVAEINEKEKRVAETWAKSHNAWFSFSDIFRLGPPGPSGSEADTYIGEGYIYKVNNLMHCDDSILLALAKFMIFNQIFPDVAYSLIGFTGFDGRNIYPVVSQPYIRGCVPATRLEIDYYMAALGFEAQGNGLFTNNDYILKDIHPKNVLKDENGEIFVIDAEVLLR